MVTSEENNSVLSSPEQILLTVIENFDGVIYSVDHNLCLTAFNSNFRKEIQNIFGQQIEIGNSVLQPLYEKHAADVPMWKELYDRGLKGERFRFEKKIEYTLPVTYWDFSFTPILFQQEILGVACHVRNITEVRQKELEHQQTQELFKLIAENPVLGIVWATPQGKMIDANETFCKILESNLEELREIYYGNYTFPEDLEIEKPLFEKLKGGIIDNYVLEKRYVTLQGKIKWVKVNLSTTKNKDNEIQYITCVVQEIGERIVAQTRLAQSESNLRAILDHMNSACLLLDNNLHIVSFNKLAENWMNIYSNRTFESGENFIELVPAKFKSLAVQMLQMVNSGMPYRNTGKYEVKEGIVNWYDIQITQVTNETHLGSGIVISVIDITGEKRREAEIKALNETLEEKVKARTAQLEASNKEMEAFTYSISHDLRAPLRNINGFAEILLEDGATMLSNEMKRNLTIIKSNAVRMGLFIDSLLEISRLGRSVLNKKEVNMKYLVNEVIEEIKIGDKLFKHEIIVNEIHNIQGDASLLKQVWQNLISNAVKYSALKENPKIEISSVMSEGKVHYTVRDNGVGFEMQFSHKLFGVFQRLHRDTEFTGTGVGLAIVKRIVQKHDGQVGVQSTPNVGTTFYFSLPL